MQTLIDRLWYNKHPLRWVLLPPSLFYCLFISIRRFFIQTFFQYKPPKPLIVVGNLTVGGVGKTPLVIALVNALQQKGLKVGIVSRGYKATLKTFPHAVTPEDNAQLVGDEPFLIAKKTGAPVVIGPKRKLALKYLLANFPCDIIVSDDGLQHYAMGRHLELLVIDGHRGLGNGLCLPAGPLREPKSRLKEVDFLIVNQGSWPLAYAMTLEPQALTQIISNQPFSEEALSLPIAAIAAIGNPLRFFKTLEAKGLHFKPYIFPDHYSFKFQDFTFKEKSIVMTEKDAVKCEAFAAPHWYFLPIEAQLEEAFWNALWSHKQLQGILPCG